MEKEMFIFNHSASLYTVDFGAGPRTILAQGGWTGSWELWTEPFQILSRSWRTVAFDHRGTGSTVAPVESITLENMVADLFALMDRLGIEKCILAAESAGGMVAVQAALQQPQRFEGLVLVDALLYRRNDGSDGRFMQEIRDWGRKILFRSSSEAAVQLISCTYDLDLRPSLSKLQIPTLILHGDQDVIVPIHDSEYMETQIPINHFHIVKGAGHVPTMTCPEEVAEQINRYFSNE
jgi:pimeloyl-ACP methyl ester carboxylesterase